MSPEETNASSESITPPLSTQKREADVQVTNAKVKLSKVVDSDAALNVAVSNENEEVKVTHQEDRKSPVRTHTTANDDNDKDVYGSEDRDESEDDGENWMERRKKWEEDCAKWDRILQPVEDALYRWYVKEHQAGKDIWIGQFATQAVVILTEMKPFLYPHKAPRPSRTESHTGGLQYKIAKRIKMDKNGSMGKARSATHASQVERHVQEIQHFLRRVRLEDIYSCTETPLYVRPNNPSRNNNDAGDDVPSDRASEIVPQSRVSVLLCANATGSDKRKLTVMCKHLPEGLQDKTLREIDIAITEDGFMTARVFSYWLQQLDRDMARQSRYIALMFDNNPVTSGCEQLQLKNITLIRLPPKKDRSFCYQPMNFIITRCFKLYYCRDMLNVTKPELGTSAVPTVPDSDLWSFLASSWDEVEPAVIRTGYCASYVMEVVRSREIESLGTWRDGDTIDLREELEKQYYWRYSTFPGLLYDTLDYIDVLFSDGPSQLTLESVRETLNSGEYKDLFVEQAEKNVAEGSKARDTLPVDDKPIFEEVRWGSDDKERFLTSLEKLSGFGSGMMRDKIKATPELKRRLFDIHQALDSLLNSIDPKQ